jgi:hypothetical protein
VPSVSPNTLARTRAGTPVCRPCGEQSASTPPFCRVRVDMATSAGGVEALQRVAGRLPHRQEADHNRHMSEGGADGARQRTAEG